jgi:terminase large subunit-like protein
MYDYEMELHTYLEKGKQDNKYKHIWLKKARGLGITEFLLRYMGHLALYSNEYHGKRFVIVTGPKVRIAWDLIARMKHLYVDYILEASRLDSLVLNGVTIEAFPSNTISMRGYQDFKFILLDEADFFEQSEQEEVLAVARGYIVKTNPWIIMVSTPHEPNSLFHRIEQMRTDEEAGFKRLQFLYNRGLGKIYQEADIEKEKEQPYFKREYEGQYSYGVGTLFSESSILNCERYGREIQSKIGSGYLSNSVRESTRKSLGIDVGWGSSRTALVLTEWLEGKVNVRYVEQFDRADYESMVKHIYNVIRQYDLDNGTNKIFIDGSAPSFISSLKSIVGEDRDYLRLVQLAKESDTETYYLMNIVPVNFSQRNQAMLDNSKRIVDKGLLAINPDASSGHKDLLTDLRIAKNKPDSFKLDKSGENKMDLFDALRLSLEYYK